jgi:hypothetical protein
LLLDGVVPADETAFDDAQCVHWTDPAASFVLDLGQMQRLEGVTLQVDNNDDYILETSTDGSRYSPYLRVRDSAGQVEWGMQTVSTLADHPAYLPELAVEPVVARYVRVGASGGDNAYGLSEIQVASRPLDAQETAALDAPPPAVRPGTLDEDGSQAAGRLAAAAGSAAPPSGRVGVTPQEGEDVTLEEAFDAIDTNRDGKLTKREYAAIWKEVTDLDKKFAFFDRDRSGFIEKQEYLSLPDAMKRGEVR